MVEILCTEGDLGDGNLIADNQGFITSLVQAYSFDTGQIVLADALPTDFQNNQNPLFVRLWQAAVPFTAGQATPLDTVSGITVTVTLPALPSNIAVRPFWHFAVRPATPRRFIRSAISTRRSRPTGRGNGSPISPLPAKPAKG